MTQVWAVFGTYSSVVDVASTVWAKWGTDVVRWAAIGNGKYKNDWMWLKIPKVN